MDKETIRDYGRLATRHLQADLMKVAKREFDAILNKLIGTPPKPVTPKRRKVRKAKPKEQ